MATTRRTFLGGLIAAVSATAMPVPATLTAAASAPPVAPSNRRLAPAIQDRQVGEWVPLGPDARITRVFAPASGALFAATDGELFRSDDASATWRQVTLPTSHQQRRAFEVDPTDHRVIYADADDGLQRSEDEGTTWTTIMASTRPIYRVVVSPADPRVLYLGQSPPMSGDFWLHRSLDRGETWEQLEEQHNSLCGWGFRIFHPHPTDPARVFRTAGCYAGRDLGDDLEDSRDNAQTFQSILAPRGGFPEALVGGSGSEPTRFYLVVNNDARMGGSSVRTSTDDGATWTPILEYPSGDAAGKAGASNVTIGGLAYDPAVPSRVFAALTRRPTPFPPFESGGVLLTEDGGASWLQLGQPDIPLVTQLQLGIDGQNLFAATANGVWRLALN